MKKGLLIVGVTFAITAAIIFGTRVSADALAVVVGVFLGVLTSVPTTLLVIFILTRPKPGERNGIATPPSPPVIVVNAAERNALAAPPALPPPYPVEPVRKWTVVGDVETEA
ncbi:MAG: hypothetical protein U0401_22665 [Anaerolineae bacterium]